MDQQIEFTMSNNEKVHKKGTFDVDRYTVFFRSYEDKSSMPTGLVANVVSAVLLFCSPRSVLVNQTSCYPWK